MNIETGKVIKIEGDSVLVESEPTSFCVSCGARDSCSMSGNSKKRCIWVRNSVGASAGDVVTFGIAEQSMVVLSLLLYLTPVIFMITGALVSSRYCMFIDDSDLAAALGGTAGLVLAFALIRIVGPMLSKRKSFSPVLLSIENTGHMENH